MSNNDIEKNLKDSADRITVKSFSERLDNIKARLSFDEESQKVLSERPVLVAAEYNTVQNTENRNMIVLIVVMCLIVCLSLVMAIVLPTVLRKKEPTYSGTPWDNPDALINNLVNEEQFYDELDKNGYEIINLSKYKYESFIIYTNVYDEVKGGLVSVYYEDEEYLIIDFFDVSVKFQYHLDPDYEVYTVGSTEIRYNTEYNDIYMITAVAQYKNINYHIVLYSLHDNYTQILDELFS